MQGANGGKLGMPKAKTMLLLGGKYLSVQATP